MDRNEFDPKHVPVEANDTEKRFHLPYDKIVTDEERVLQIINDWKNSNLQIVVADAVLDIPHYRHPDYFLACANYGDRLVVRLATDKLVREKKNPEGPIVQWTERAKHASHYPYINLIVPKKQNDWEWVVSFRPNVIVSSVTSPVFVIKQLIKNRPQLDESRVNLIALDEFANQIPFESLYEQCVMYNKNKGDKDKFSGTIIKGKISRRAIENYLREINQ